MLFAVILVLIDKHRSPCSGTANIFRLFLSSLVLAIIAFYLSGGASVARVRRTSAKYKYQIQKPGKSTEYPIVPPGTFPVTTRRHERVPLTLTPTLTITSEPRRLPSLKKAYTQTHTISLALTHTHPHRRTFFDQPSLDLSPAVHFNMHIPSELRNPVPLSSPQEESLARAIADRFDGVSVEGTRVSTAGVKIEDGFGGCAQGAGPLVNMSDFLLMAPGAEEQGASR